MALSTLNDELAQLRHVMMFEVRRHVIQHDELNEHDFEVVFDQITEAVVNCTVDDPRIYALVMQVMSNHLRGFDAER